MFGVMTLLFLLLRVSGDPAGIIAGQEASPEVIEQVRDQLGLNDPLPQQYLAFLAKVVTLDFGTSLARGQDALDLILAALPMSLQLVGASFLLAVVLAIPLGMIAGVSRSRALQRFTDGLILVGQAIPIFWLAIVLVWLLAVDNDFVPSIFVGGFRSWIVPVISLASFPFAHLVQFTRSGLHEAMTEDFTRTATAKGLPQRTVVMRHGMRPVGVSLITVAGLDLGQMLSGVVLVEVIFAWPGIGQLIVSAVGSRDYPLVEASTMILAAMVVIINFVVDIAYEWIDPRIRVN